MRNVILFALLFTTIGCVEPGEQGERKGPRRRRNRPAPIVEPVKREGFAEIGATHLKARIELMRKAASEIRAGNCATIRDVNTLILNGVRQIVDRTNDAMATRFENDLQTEDDKLPSNASELFDKYASELESLLK